MNNKDFLSLTPNIMVEDVNKTIDFYKNILGFQTLMTVPEAGKFNWALISRGDVMLMLQQQESLAEEYPLFAKKPIGGSLIFL